VSKELRHLEEPGMQTLLSACKSRRDYLLIRTLWKTRCRISEVLALTRDGIDPKRGTIAVPALKLKRKDRMKFPVVDKETLTILADYARSNKASVFPITRERAFHIVRDIGRRAGLPGIRPHVLRHSFADHWARQGRDLVKLQGQLGHSRAATTTKSAQHNYTKALPFESALEPVTRDRRCSPEVLP